MDKIEVLSVKIYKDGLTKVEFLNLETGEITKEYMPLCNEMLPILNSITPDTEHGFESVLNRINL